MPFAAYGVATLIFLFGDKDKYQQKLWNGVALDMHYLYVAVYLFSRLVVWLNSYPVSQKNKVVKINSGELRGNQFFYKVMG